MLDLTTQPKINHIFRLQFEESQNNFVLLYPEGMIKLNDSAANILQYCDGNHSLDDIINSLKERFGNSADIENDVTEFIQQAYEKQWLK
ncbi:Coenzyme PQQ synthesis protein D [uncultured Gammaproteobacteria bacterium]|jgi:pyrroloquinoline quinone biosynthesis protein D|uniref:pyrroloquinoline quinone biosynthesis peptide chaperone PqqD n=1 Tax=thiotrophic endosymbiont of Bathymodiolus puteoserpentis (Logatchev) TaxID=343240 RepID=UPI0010BA52CA|nr:pyrroloquinoline quinone biosynthesis peptide chaperone PqqD [thiotrophic endosymbiont of Bathymodiolus puteoserpentis (Logatchev)]CAC9503121.1 Coenzyme PQQ synthesis protein D [uncultured Gammaproteobacteria bacterium]CAC9576056.1 Coenzyme PQQ synthesis protein D [uncultured Gammaproteobacteria bacterium]CAC9581083.1 Coenzyme PQQ synthesis protein D [uncultured Gammaproteobacteria bacterium]CAC9651944.1 Coenzyme PQQ synthesis protein D [uncultured Gammaproteobacteria bacterium]CAC9653341.1